MSAPGGPAALPKNKKQVLEENLAADRGKETNALLLARLLQGKVTELHDARESARREAHQLRRTPRLNPTVRQSALGLGEMSQSRMLQSEDAWTRSVSHMSLKSVSCADCW